MLFTFLQKPRLYSEQIWRCFYVTCPIQISSYTGSQFELSRHYLSRFWGNLCSVFTLLTQKKPSFCHCSVEFILPCYSYNSFQYETQETSLKQRHPNPGAFTKHVVNSFKQDQTGLKLLTLHQRLMPLSPRC